MITDTNADQGEFVWRMEDGRTGHTVRQSELGNYVGMCPEQTRLSRLHPERRRENDATASGTAVHAGIEMAVKQLMVGDTLTLDEMTGVAIEEFARLEADPSFVVVSNDHSTCESNIRHAMRTFHRELFPTLHPMGSEIPFRRLVLHEDDKRVIYANGTVDYHDFNLGLVDFKTASSAHRAWEKQRWNIQSVMYPWAMKQIGQLDPKAPDDFTFLILINGKSLQTLKVTRTNLHIDWMRKQALQMALQVEADLAHWPLNDAGWWCSSKWCPFFPECKGKFVQI